MAKKPARPRWAYFSFFPEDFWGGTVGWTGEQQLAYLKLICACHASEDGTIPSDSAYLARVAGDRRHWHYKIKNVVLTKFRQLPNGRIFNPRVMADRQAINRQVTDTSGARKLAVIGVPDKGVPDKSAPTKSKSANKINDCAPQPHPKTGVDTRARLPNPKNTPLPPLPEPAPSPGGWAAQAPTAPPKPINATALSDEERAKAERDAIAFIEQTFKP